MANLGQELYNRALGSTLKITRTGFIVENASVFKRNFAGREETGVRKDGKKFVKHGQRFTIGLTEEQMSALKAVGNFNHGAWHFDQENPELTLYTVEIKINMNSNYPPTLKMFSRLNGRNKITDLNAGTMNVLDSVDAERWDITVHAWEQEPGSGDFSLYLRDGNVIAVDPKAEQYGGAYAEFYSELADDEDNSFPSDR